MAVYDDYMIPAGYRGVLYAGDVFYYTGEPDEYLDVASPVSMGEEDPVQWFEDLDGCIEDIEQFDHEHLFRYPHQDYAFARVVIDGIELDGTEEPEETGWNYNRLAWPAYLGEIIENPDFV